MSIQTRILFGFHAVGVRLKVAPQSVLEVFVDASRRDARMKQFLVRAQQAQLRVIEADGPRLNKLAGGAGHQGVVARVRELPQARSLDDLLDALAAQPDAPPPLLLTLDGVTDPHNLGACLRVADGAGVHAVIAPRDHAAGISATEDAEHDFVAFFWPVRMLRIHQQRAKGVKFDVTRCFCAVIKS